MNIERKFLLNYHDANLSSLRYDCIGCDDCIGACLALLELTQVPEILLRTQKGRS